MIAVGSTHRRVSERSPLTKYKARAVLWCVRQDERDLNDLAHWDTRQQPVELTATCTKAFAYPVCLKAGVAVASTTWMISCSAHNPVGKPGGDLRHETHRHYCKH